MSSSAARDIDVNTIRYITTIFVQIWSYLLLMLGTIGHSLNIYIFTRPSLRSNPCVRYFLASSISGFLVVYVNVLLRFLQQKYNLDAFGYSDASCKILLFLVLCTRYIE